MTESQKPMVPGPWLPKMNLEVGVENMAIFGIAFGITLLAAYGIYKYWGD
jgi:hypothetical protein